MIVSVIGDYFKGEDIMKGLGYRLYFSLQKVWDYIKMKLHPFRYFIFVLDILLIIALPFVIVYGGHK
jgi:hypothetical protein